MTLDYIIYLDSEPRSAFLDFYGHSGQAYRFLWSERHRAMIYTGEPISGVRFDVVADDIFRATPAQNFCRAVPRRVAPIEQIKVPVLPVAILQHPAPKPEPKVPLIRPHLKKLLDPEREPVAAGGLET